MRMNQSRVQAVCHLSGYSCSGGRRERHEAKQILKDVWGKIVFAFKVMEDDRKRLECMN